MVNTPNVFVTGASGQLGGLVVDMLLETLPPRAIKAGVRGSVRGDAASDALRAKGVEVRQADYTLPATLADAFRGVDRLLLVSSSENGRRTLQHRNVIAAAKDAGVGLIAYTSILHADTSPIALAEEHRDTEQALAACGVPFTLLRNGWYSEVFTWRLPLALANGVLLGAAADGRISSAARADYARAAATVLTGDGHENRIYELAGDHAFTLGTLANVVAATSGKPMTYRDMAPDAFRAAMLHAGVPEMVADILSNVDAGIAKDALFDESGDLARLLGRPTTPLERTIAAFVSSHEG